MKIKGQHPLLEGTLAEFWMRGAIHGETGLALTCWPVVGSIPTSSTTNSTPPIATNCGTGLCLWISAKGRVCTHCHFEPTTRRKQGSNDVPQLSDRVQRFGKSKAGRRLASLGHSWFIQEEGNHGGQTTPKRRSLLRGSRAYMTGSGFSFPNFANASLIASCCGFT